MPNIFPFRAVRYNTDRAGSLSNLTTQPYDRISTEQQSRYYDASPYNFVRVILPRENELPDRYAYAGDNIRQWSLDKILISEANECMYVYFQTYNLNGCVFTRKGIVSLVDISDHGKKIQPHEEIQSHPVKDRLNLLSATNLLTEPLMLIYEDPRKQLDSLYAEACKQKPLMNVTDEFGAIHKVWKIADAGTICYLQDYLFPFKAFIADGHHRYETTRIYFEKLAQSGAKAMRRAALAALFNARDPEVRILPIHRCLNVPILLPKIERTLGDDFYFEGYDMSADPEFAAMELIEDVAVTGLSGLAFGFCSYGDGRAILARSRNTANDIPPSVYLQERILEPIFKLSWDDLRDQKYISYTSDAREALLRTLSGEVKFSIIVTPPSVAQVVRRAEQKKIFPPKSTDFHPKLLSGLLMARAAE